MRKEFFIYGKEAPHQHKFNPVFRAQR